MKPRPTMQEEWEDYAQKVLHPEAGAIQRTELKRAFFAGAWALLMWQMEMANQPYTDEQAEAELSKIHKELLAFGANGGLS